MSTWKLDNIGVVIYNYVMKSKAKDISTPVETPEEEKTQLLIKVSKRIKAKAQQEADLSFTYGWIPSATVTQLFIWLIDIYLDTAIKDFIVRRRQGNQVDKKQEEVQDGDRT